MFDVRNHGKIGNNEISLWRLELSPFHYEIRHKPGVENVAPDILSRAYASSNSRDRLTMLRASLAPGIRQALSPRSWSEFTFYE